MKNVETFLPKVEDDRLLWLVKKPAPIVLRKLPSDGLLA